MRAHVLATWSMFPLFWILAPTGFVIFEIDWDALLYLALDVIMNSFGAYISTPNIRTKQVLDTMNLC